MKKYVIDASLIVSSLLKTHPKAAVELEKLLLKLKTKEIELYSTSFIDYEVANGLRFTLGDLKKSLGFLERFSKIPIKLFSFSQNHLQEILKLSYQLNTTIYDTSYHFLAKLLGGTFVTCDKQYFNKAKKLGDIIIV
jgi:predicted nucleic acid-binding protein